MTSIDRFDTAILKALQNNGAMTNAALAELVHLSASQCSRRRSALEEAGLIKGYAARLDATKLGYGLRAITRVNLQSHGQRSDGSFARFIQLHPQIRAAFSVAGDADYVLDLRMRDLDDFAEFLHEHLLPHPQVAHVRSEIVLKTLKEDEGISLE